MMNPENSPRKNRILLALAIFFVAMMITFWVGKDPAVIDAEREAYVDPIAKAETENLAWNCPLTDGDGNTVEMRDLYNEKPVYVVFWMPWSDESIAQLDALAPTYEAYHDKVTIIAVAMDRSRDEALTVATEKQWPMMVYTTPMETAGDYNITSVPTSIVIAKGGQISSRDSSVLTEKQLAYKLERAIAQSQKW